MQTTPQVKCALLQKAGVGRMCSMRQREGPHQGCKLSSFFTALLRYNPYTNIIYLKHTTQCSLLDRITEMCNQDRFQNISIIPKGNCKPISPKPSQSQATTDLSPTNLPTLHTSCKWNHISLWSLATGLFDTFNVYKIHPCYSLHQFFILFYC